MRLSRDPALWLGLVAALVSIVSSFVFPLTVDQQAVLNAVAVAAAGALTAFLVRRDGQAAAIVGLAQAVIACGLGFGLDVSPEGQAALMAVVSTAAAMFVRTQVTAKVDAAGSPALVR
jgi:hypothetical protein